MVGSRVAGTLLCHAGVHRLAFCAHDVSAIEAASRWRGPLRCARRAFGPEEGAARVLVAEGGEAVGVDALEIEAESLYVLPAPELLRRVAGGSLLGFVLARGEFWPLVRLVDFARYVGALAREAA